MHDIFKEQQELQKCKLIKLIEEERKSFETQSLNFLNWDYPNISQESSIVLDKVIFLSENLKYINSLLFFPTKDILNKLSLMNVSRHTTRWFVDINEIENILLNLSNNEEVFFPVAEYFVLAKQHLLMNAKIAFITEGNGLGFETFYKGNETNLGFKTLAEAIRKEAQRKKTGYNSKSSEIENAYLNLYKEIQAKYNGEINFSKLLQGSDKTFLKIFDVFYGENVPSRKIYLLLFDLIKLIHKDLDLLDEDRFDNEYEGNCKDYEAYKYIAIKNFITNL